MTCDYGGQRPPADFIKAVRAMENDKNAGHQAAILDQFTRQAVPFSQQPAHSQEAFLDLMLQMSGVGPADIVLDVACGPGLVACAFAARAQHVTGIDLTPAMIARAKQIQQERKLTNLTWQVGDVLPLPYPDASFSLVITRYTFHHFLDPRAVFAEMVRVCTRGREGSWWPMSRCFPENGRPSTAWRNGGTPPTPAACPRMSCYGWLPV